MPRKINFSHALRPGGAFLALPIALLPSYVAAQERPDCIFDSTASSTVQNPNVPTDNWAITRTGEWTADTAENRGEVYFNSVRSRLWDGPPIDIAPTVLRSFVHFDADVGVAGEGGLAPGDERGFCNLRVYNDGLYLSPDGPRLDVTFDTLDGYTILFDQVALGSPGLNVPVRNENRRLRINHLTLEDTDLTLNGLQLLFFDPRQGGQGAEATITLDNASINGSAAPPFGTSATAGDPVPLRITSKGGAGVVNSLSFGDRPGGRFISAGTTNVDIIEGSTFELYNTGQAGTNSEDIFLFPGVSQGFGGFFSTAWTFDVGPDGNGGTLRFDDANVRFENGRVNLHDNARFDVDFSSSIGKSEIAELVFVGDGATHAASLNATSTIAAIRVEGDYATIDHAGGVVDADAVEVRAGAKGTIVTGTLSSVSSTAWSLFLADQPVTFRNINSAISQFTITPFTANLNSTLVFDNANLTLQPQEFSGVLALTLRSGANIEIPVEKVFGTRFDVTVEAGDGTPSILRLGGQQDLGTHYDFNVVANAPFGLLLDDKGLFAASGDVSIPGRNSDIEFGLEARLFPGDTCGALCSGSAPAPAFGTFGTEGRIRFSPLSEVTLDIGRTAGGELANDALRYGDNPLGFSDISKTTFQIRRLGFSDARDIDGATFVLVEKTPGTNGGIKSNDGASLETQLIFDASFPAALNFFIIEEPSETGRLVIGAEADLTQLIKQTDSRNHRNLVTGLVGQGTTNAGSTQPPTLMNGTDLATALHSLTAQQNALLISAHAEPFSSYQTVILEDYDMVAGIVLGRAGGTGLSFSGISTPSGVIAATRHVSAEGEDQTETTSRAVWGTSGYVSGSVDGNSDLGSFGYDIFGLVLGVDIYNDGKTRAGAFGAINLLTLDEHDTITQNLDGISYHLGGYVNWEGESGLALSGVIGLATGNHESDRLAPDVGAFSGGLAKAEFKARGFYTGAAIEQKLTSSESMWSVIPSLTTLFSRTEQKGVKETGGGDFNFALDEGIAESLTTAAGITIGREFRSEGHSVTLLGSMHYRYDWLAGNEGVHETTASNPVLGTFTQIGQNHGAEGLTAGFGLAGSIFDDLEFGVGYAYTWNENGRERAFSANLLLEW